VAVTLRAQLLDAAAALIDVGWKCELGVLTLEMPFVRERSANRRQVRI
jgi:hypothetical protein